MKDRKLGQKRVTNTEEPKKQKKPHPLPIRRNDRFTRGFFLRTLCGEPWKMKRTEAENKFSELLENGAIVSIGRIFLIGDGVGIYGYRYTLDEKLFI